MENLLRNIVSWWAGDATGIAMVAPFLLVVLSRFGKLWDQPPTEEAAKAALPSCKEVPVFALQMIAMVVALLAAYRFELPGTLEYSYFAFAPLMWIAVSNGFVRTTFGIVVANFGAAILAATRNVEEVGVPLQFSLMTLTIVGLLVAGIVTERNLVSKLLAYEALHDPLTGLPNRKLFLRQLEEAAHRAAKEPEYGFAVFFLSLNRFKAINSNRGHPFGDQLLKAVAGRLTSRLRPQDTVARYGGAEFLIQLDGDGSKQEAVRMAKSLTDGFKEPYVLESSQIQASASVGIALGENGFGEPENLIRDADLALRRAKANPQTDCVLFDGRMREQAEERFRLETDLRRAVFENELELEYQLIYSVVGGRPVRAEALARWRHPERGPVPPDQFIPLAEEMGLIVDLGHQVLLQACRQMRSWLKAGHDLSKISVNVSPLQLEHPRFVEGVLDAIEESGLGAHHLQLELTEYWRIDTPEADAKLRRLAGAGISLFIDDFGTGYSSLDYLGKLPFHGLKIDRSFIQPLPEEPEDATGTSSKPYWPSPAKWAWKLRARA